MNHQAWINHYRWKNRLVIVVVNSPHNEDYLAFKKDYEKHRKGVIERKLVRKTIVQTRVKPGFQLALYTLDGKLEKRVQKVITVDDMFKLIDQMHLRKAEIKKNEKSNVIQL